MTYELQIKAKMENGNEMIEIWKFDNEKEMEHICFELRQLNIPYMIIRRW